MMKKIKFTNGAGTVLIQAMDKFQVAKRQHKENVKNQYNDKVGADGAKTYFRASGMGDADRKLIYTFFAHQLPKVPKKAQNLRQLENGDFVHDRYQNAWEEMGVVLSMESRLTSRDDEYLGQFPWEWTGHHDGLLDVRLLRAFAEGFATVTSERNEETGQFEIVVDIDDAYGRQIGLFLADGSLNPEYVPLTMVADIKTMNPWVFKGIKEKGDVSKIAGYLDQISFYMYMLGTPYGTIYIEAKDNNDVLEVQVLWRDFYGADNLVGWEDEIHGKQSNNQVRVVIDSGRFFGSETSEGIVPRISRLHGIVEALRAANEAGDAAAVAALMPTRCADEPGAFPCSWGHKNGAENIAYCEFYEHCWSTQHQGLAVRTYEVPTLELIPEEFRWVFLGDDEVEIHVDSRKVPVGIAYDGFITLVEGGMLDYTKFLADVQPADLLNAASEVSNGMNQAAAAVAQGRDEESKAINSASSLFGSDGTLFIGQPDAPTEAQEYIAEGGSKAIACLKCKTEITYQKLGAGFTKKCTFCSHSNKVKKL